MERKFKYVVIGAGLAGCSAVEGIRAKDPEGTILLVGSEEYLPYNRPPLTKQLWFGKKKVEDIFVQPQQYFRQNNIDVLQNIKALKIDAASKTVTFNEGTCNYEKLLLATGGIPRRLNIEGGDLQEIYYYRYLNDFMRLKPRIQDGTKVLVIGSGFIGSEIAAGLRINKADVTILMRDEYLVQNIFPKDLGMAIQNDFIERGVRIFTQDSAVSIARRNSHLVTRTKAGKEISSEIIVVGIGIEPETQLAKSAGLSINNGVVVNEFLQTSSPDIYAAGDNANFPYSVFATHTRVEHWDNALNQGKYAGMNMAGTQTTYDYMPYFFSDLFDFGYEAVGQINSKFETYADWQKENNTGVVYYLQDDKVKGMMMCNVWDKVDAARELIKSNKLLTKPQLQGAVR